MFRKLLCIISFVAAIGIGLTIPAQAADPDLAAYWKFDDGSGTTAFDSSGNGNNGTFNGNPQWVAGKFGGALQFDGDDYLNCGNGPSLQIQEQITIAFWFQVQAFQNTWEGFLAKGDNSYRASRGGGTGNATHMGISGTSTGGGNGWFNGTVIVTGGDWHHYAATYDGTEGRIYIDGVLDVTSPGTGQINSSTYDLYIGENSQATGRFFHGLLDEVRIYSRALTDVEILGVMAGGGAEYPLASAPSPADGSLLQQTWGTLGWRAGDFALSHDVYLSDNFADVNDGAETAFRGNQTSTMLIVGFTGFPYPDGLVPGTTYYWRIDEINDGDPNSPWVGTVWSFTVPPKTAYSPVPADGAKFVATDATLGWTAGFGAKLHTVYFGDDFDAVSNAAGGAPQGNLTFRPTALEPDKIYYWRVDEFEAPLTHKGDVWSFTTAGLGGGVKGQYFRGMNFENLMLTRTDPRINFNWGDPGGPDTSVGDDNFSCRWTGEVEAPFTETYTFYTNSDDGVRLWVDGKQLVNNWTDHGATENRGTIDLVEGQTYSVVMEYYENGGGAVAELRWSSPRTPKQLIPQAALSFLVHAYAASPANGTQGVNLMSDLTWGPGDSAASHEVYLGTDPDLVASATKASPEYKGSKARGDEASDPGRLDFDTTYYWRVDEVNNANPDSPWKGNVWNFWTGDFLVVDSFESYDDVDPPVGQPGINRIFDKWLDGFGTTTNGALVGNDLPPYAEQTTVHSGAQSMIYRYDNNLKTSEATLTLVFPTDWTTNGVTKLSLWFSGAAANAADRIFVALGNAVVYHPDPAATQMAGWNNLVIDLQDFAGKGANLTNIGSVTIGIGTRNSPAAGGTGTLYFDDIRLIQ